MEVSQNIPLYILEHFEIIKIVCVNMVVYLFQDFTCTRSRLYSPHKYTLQNRISWKILIGQQEKTY